MSNIIKVPHTVNFVAEFNIDAIPANLLPALIALSEEQLTEYCTMATIAAIEHVNLIGVANEGSEGWAHVSLA